MTNCSFEINKKTKKNTAVTLIRIQKQSRWEACKTPMCPRRKHCHGTIHVKRGKHISRPPRIKTLKLAFKTLKQAILQHHAVIHPTSKSRSIFLNACVSKRIIKGCQRTGVFCVRKLEEPSSRLFEVSCGLSQPRSTQCCSQGEEWPCQRT